MKKGESENIEFKEKFNKETIETAAAFANTKGGVILIGFSDKGKVNGVQIGKETLKDWANQISQSTEPRIIPEIEQNEIEGKMHFHSTDMSWDKLSARDAVIDEIDIEKVKRYTAVDSKKRPLLLTIG